VKLRRCLKEITDLPGSVIQLETSKYQSLHGLSGKMAASSCHVPPSDKAR
jgi:hypothetical protein